MLNHFLALCGLNGVSGFEDAVRDYIRHSALPYADEIREDPAGNLMILRRGTNSRKTVMLCAHMDETGFIVKHICPDGLLKFDTIGDFPLSIVPGMHVYVGDARIPGIIGLKPIHLISRKERGETPPVDNLHIDIGARSRAEAEHLSFPGDYAAFAADTRDFGNNLFLGKALDSRTGCAVLLQLLQKPYLHDVWYVFSVQRQIGSGIQSAAYRLTPDYALVLDGVETDDLPGCTQPGFCMLGKGVVLPSVTGAARIAPSLLNAAKCAAKAYNIPVQEKMQMESGDTEKISGAALGIPVLSVGLPVRYLHRACNVICKKDVHHFYTLVEHILSDLC